MIATHQVMYQIVVNTAFVEGMGCFWGAEKLFWNMEGVYSTQVSHANLLLVKGILQSVRGSQY